MITWYVLDCILIVFSFLGYQKMKQPVYNLCKCYLEKS